MPARHPPSPASSDLRTIVFSHANGLPAGIYEALFAAWRSAGWRVLALERFGHDPSHPVSSGWPHLRDELLAFIRREARDEPMALVGHSMGGYLSLLAASRLPTQVRAVVLLDSPIVAGWRSHGFRLLEATGLLRRGGPGKVSARRRDHWPDMTAVREHFQSRRAFAAWDARCFDHYLQHAFEAAPDGGVQLAFRRDVETRIYETLPHHVEPLLRRRPLTCPVSYIEGAHSTEGRQLGLGFVRQLAGTRWRTVDGSHLFPLEQPDTTARAVLELLGRAAAGAHL